MPTIFAFKVRQWLPEWSTYQYNEANRQRRPAESFYVLSLSARLLRRLSGIHRRTPEGPRALDTNVQRAHEATRSREIARFVIGGYPWAQLNTGDRERFAELKKPGWLPTAIVVNALGPGSVRHDERVAQRDLIRIRDSDGPHVEVSLPEGSDQDNWRPDGTVLPVEIIDGQHRLLAFDEPELADVDFDLPVVMFYDLDVSWQAYLFWTINITPKRISPSFAFDLYPLLRTQDWLERIEGPLTYRETRAQELTEALWSHPDSPWRNRIGMLTRERGKVSQAAFVRSLTLSFVRRWDAREGRTGGLFGAELEHGRPDVLNWNRAQQAAYLIQLWTDLEQSVRESEAEWAIAIRARPGSITSPDPAFSGEYTLLASDQGVRGFLQVANDLSYVNSRAVGFAQWSEERTHEPINVEEVSQALSSLRSHPAIVDFARRLATACAGFDWRSAALPGLEEHLRTRQSLYKGGTGYKEVRRQLLRFLEGSDDSLIAEPARRLVDALGYR